MVLFAIGFAVSTAWAGPGIDGVLAARQALVDGDTERASMLLMQARPNLASETQILTAKQVAELVYLEGLTPRLAGLEREQDVDKWRDALTIYPTLRWDRELLNDKALRGYFEALRAEVSQREPVPTRVPAERGLLKAYVDGVEHAESQAVLAGQHLIQVQCPDGEIRGQWSNLQRAPEWLELCPNPVDLSVPTPVAEEFEFAMDEAVPGQGPDPLTWVEPVAPVRVRQPLRIPKRAMWIGAGVAGALSLATYTAALAARAKYDKTDPPKFNSVSELESQRRKTNRLVGASGGLMLVAGGLGVAAVVGGEF